MPVYNEEMEAWIEAPDLEFTDIDNNSTIKTNFLICQRNFSNLKKWLSGLKAYIRYLRSLIDIDNIVNEVLDKLRKTKPVIPISYSMKIGQVTTYTDSTTKINYQIKRVDAYTIEITNISEESWFVDRLMIYVKNFDGTIVYPVVKTISSKITIYFADGLSTNYNVYFM